MCFLGPTLPVDMWGTKPLIEHPDGGVIFISGSSIYHLPHAGPDASWTLLPQKIKTPRPWTNMFFVPDDIVNCK